MVAMNDGQASPPLLPTCLMINHSAHRIAFATQRSQINVSCGATAMFVKEKILQKAAKRSQCTYVKTTAMIKRTYGPLPYSIPFYVSFVNVTSDDLFHSTFLFASPSSRDSDFVIMIPATKAYLESSLHFTASNREFPPSNYNIFGIKVKLACMQFTIIVSPSGYSSPSPSSNGRCPPGLSCAAASRNTLNGLMQRNVMISFKAMMYGESGGHFVIMNGWMMAITNSYGDHVLHFRICVSPGPLVHDYHEGSGIVKVNAGAFPVVADVQIHHPSCPGKAHIDGWCFWRGGKVHLQMVMAHADHLGSDREGGAFGSYREEWDRC
ncbi:hypothetical protein M405DRAFT_838471 [Rhizopogon salebrosus TDB-379]|nr:hypothetical protein M405DRAFT_838471 [Rhizopogon salebrosus TDB-379]